MPLRRRKAENLPRHHPQPPKIRAAPRPIQRQRLKKPAPLAINAISHPPRPRSRHQPVYIRIWQIISSNRSQKPFLSTDDTDDTDGTD
jgi:hypothetical protein